MTKLLTSFAALVVLAGFAMPAYALEPLTQKQVSALRANCVSDYMSHCMSISPSSKEAFLCLRKNMNSLSSGCQAAMRAASTPKG